MRGSVGSIPGTGTSLGWGGGPGSHCAGQSCWAGSSEHERYGQPGCTVCSAGKHLHQVGVFSLRNIGILTCMMYISGVPRSCFMILPDMLKNAPMLKWEAEGEGEVARYKTKFREKEMKTAKLDSLTGSKPRQTSLTRTATACCCHLLHTIWDRFPLQHHPPPWKRLKENKRGPSCNQRNRTMLLSYIGIVLYELYNITRLPRAVTQPVLQF